MNLKWFGVILIVGACGTGGFLKAGTLRLQQNSLRQFVQLLDFMCWELEYQMTPLPELCKHAANRSGQAIALFFNNLVLELNKQIEPDVERCVKAALRKTQGLPRLTVTAVEQLGASLGQFDLSGQMKGIEAVRQYCNQELQRLDSCLVEKTRLYQTLGFCVGAVITILLF